MAEKSRLKFNPTTQEIEIEGTEQFVKKYFDLIYGMPMATRSSKPVEKIIEPTTGKKKIGKGKRGGMTNSVLSLIQGSKKGITTKELSKKTGLASRQIWAIIYKAEREGKIKKAGRGVYISK